MNSNSNVVPLNTRWSCSVGGKWDAVPYTIGDFPPFNTFPMIPWTNPFDGFQPYVPPKQPEITWTFSGFSKPEVYMSKEQSKLDQIKGLIEGFRLAYMGDPVPDTPEDHLMDKILEVINEK